MVTISLRLPKRYAPPPLGIPSELSPTPFSYHHTSPEFPSRASTVNDPAIIAPVDERLISLTCSTVLTQPPPFISGGFRGFFRPRNISLNSTITSLKIQSEVFLALLRRQHNLACVFASSLPSNKGRVRAEREGGVLI